MARERDMDHVPPLLCICTLRRYRRLWRRYERSHPEAHRRVRDRPSMDAVVAMLCAMQIGQAAVERDAVRVFRGTWTSAMADTDLPADLAPLHGQAGADP